MNNNPAGAHDHDHGVNQVSWIRSLLAKFNIGASYESMICPKVNNLITFPQVSCRKAVCRDKCGSGRKACVQILVSCKVKQRGLFPEMRLVGEVCQIEKTSVHLIRFSDSH